MVQQKGIIKNGAGIHCRPSAIIIKEACSYPGELLLESPNGSCDLRSVLDLISLGLDVGTEVTISVSGPDEEMFCKKMIDLLEFVFDFPPT